MKPKLLRNKEIIEKIENIQKYLSKKAGKKIPFTKTIELAFSNDRICNDLLNCEIDKVPRRKKKYVVKM